MRVAGCFCLFLNVLFGRAFGQIPSFGTEFHLWVACGSLVGWLVVALVGKALAKRERLLFACMSVALLGSFASQSIVALEVSVSPGISSAPSIAMVSSVLFSLGNVLYLLLWTSALSRFKATDALSMLTVGCMGGIVITDGILALGGTSETELHLYHAVRLLMLIASLVCLGITLFGAPRAFRNSQKTPHRLQRSARFLPVVSVAAVFALLNFVLNSSWARSEETSQTGVITLPLEALLVGAVILVVTRLLKDQDDFTLLFCQASAVGSLVLYLVFVSVTGGMIDYLWIAVHAGNILIELAVLALCTQLFRQEGAGAVRQVALIFACKELASLLGSALFAAVPHEVLIAVNLVLLVLAIGGCSFVLFRTTKKTRGQAASEYDAVAALAEDIAQQVGCTAREKEVLVLLLQGSSYARIAKRLVIAESTVKTHANHIYGKIGVASRDELIDFCYDRQTRSE